MSFKVKNVEYPILFVLGGTHDVIDAGIEWSGDKLGNGYHWVKGKLYDDNNNEVLMITENGETIDIVDPTSQVIQQDFNQVDSNDNNNGEVGQSPDNHDGKVGQSPDNHDGKVGQSPDNHDGKFGQS